jgi:hypothetical protein
MRTAFRIDALIRKPQPLYRPAAHKMLLHNLRRVRGLHVAVPDSFRVNNHRRPMLALIQTAGFVDADFAGETGGFR